MHVCLLCALLSRQKDEWMFPTAPPFHPQPPAILPRLQVQQWDHQKTGQPLIIASLLSILLHMKTYLSQIHEICDFIFVEVAIFTVMFQNKILQEKGDTVRYDSKQETSKTVTSTVCVHAKSIQSCLTLSDPMDCSLRGSYVQGILQARILESVAMPFSSGCS